MQSNPCAWDQRLLLKALFSQTADEVAEIAIRANQRGKVVVIPGWHNRLAVGLMRTLPEPLVRAIIGAGAAKYHLGD